MHSIFVYGTLLNDEVLEIVLGRNVKKIPKQEACLQGYKRVKVLDEEFPAIFPDKTSQVDGALIEGLTAEDLDNLDVYESQIYQKKQVVVTLSSGGSCDCMVYVIKPKYQSLLSHEEWCNHTFRKEHLPLLLAYLEA